MLDLLTDTSSANSLVSKFASLWTPPERLPLSSWAEKNITLSPEYAARSTKLQLFSWQREMFDAFTDPSVGELVLMVSTQMVKTIILQCAIAYIICEDPGPILLVQPKEDDGKAFVKERLHPMIRDCACLHGLISDSSHDSNSTLLAKNFPGGNLSIVSSIVPGNLARRSIRYLFCDEIDKYPPSAKEEGDPINLAWERTSTYESRRKMILCCSPTIAGKSRIGKAYEGTDQRKLWVPCPSCNHFQLLSFREQVKWEDGLPETAVYECANLKCRSRWDDFARWSAIDKGEWRASRPFAGKAGFWISHLYAPWRSKSLGQIAKGFVTAKREGRNQLKVFINTNLAQLWEEEGDATDPEKLYARRESYPFNDAAVVPKRGLFLTASVDVQEEPPRLEVELKAWGRNREWWSLGYWVLQSFSDEARIHPMPVTSPELWAKLDELLQRSWPHESGHVLPILVMCIDTGRRPKPVYEFAKRHAQLAYGPNGIRVHAVRTVVPVKGNDDQLRIISGISKEDAARKRQGVRIVMVGTHCAKQELYDGLQHARPGDVGHGHWPEYAMSYFEGLCAEVRVTKANGKVEYEQRRERNEPVDLAIYSRAAAAVYGIDRFTEDQWLALERALDPSLIIQAVGSHAPPPVRSDVGPTANPASPSPSPARSPASSSPVRPIRGRFL